MTTIDELTVLIHADVGGLVQGVEQARTKLQQLEMSIRHTSASLASMSTLEREVLAGGGFISGTGEVVPPNSKRWRELMAGASTALQEKLMAEARAFQSGSSGEGGFTTTPTSPFVSSASSLHSVLTQQLEVLREIKKDTARLVEAQRMSGAGRMPGFSSRATGTAHEVNDSEVAKRILLFEKSGENAGLANYTPSF
ncbi:MAG: hypothetical protein ACXQT1_02050 [Methermicoccaceae archaeon]